MGGGGAEQGLVGINQPGPVAGGRRLLAETQPREQPNGRGPTAAGQMLAHEIRNSLKPVVGSIELLRGEIPSGGVAGELMEIIRVRGVIAASISPRSRLKLPSPARRKGTVTGSAPAIRTVSPASPA